MGHPSYPTHIVSAAFHSSITRSPKRRQGSASKVEIKWIVIVMKFAVLPRWHREEEENLRASNRSDRTPKCRRIDRLNRLCFRASGASIPAKKKRKVIGIAMTNGYYISTQDAQRKNNKTISGTRKTGKTYAIKRLEEVDANATTTACLLNVFCVFALSLDTRDRIAVSGAASRVSCFSDNTALPTPLIGYGLASSCG
jgi:hypothetical protein